MLKYIIFTTFSALMLILCILYAFQITVSSGTQGLDDAYISFRYIDRLYDGHGLSWNDNYYVQGYSNLLWVLILFLGKFIISNIYYITIIINFASFLFISYFIYNKTIDRTKDIEYGVLFLVSISTLNYIVWITSGLESILFSTIIFFILYFTEKATTEYNIKYIYYIGTLSTISILLRLDGFIIPVLCTIYIIYKNDFNKASLYLITYLLFILLSLIAWQYLYYGFPLPNTYYVKVSGNILERIYVGLFWLCYSMIIYGLMFFPIVQVYEYLKTRKINIYFLYTIFIIAYYLFIGSDSLRDRFFLLFPILGATSYINLIQKHGKTVLRLSMLLIILINLLVISVFLFQFQIYKSDNYLNNYSYWKELGIFLGEHYDKNTLIATDGAGNIPYFSNLPTIDMLGLNDINIAHKDYTNKFAPGHSKYDANYIVSKNPNLIMTWIDINQNLKFGFNKDFYTKNNYKLRYLLYVNSGKCPDKCVVDVNSMADILIENYYLNGYKYGIIEKQ